MPKVAIPLCEFVGYGGARKERILRSELEVIGSRANELFRGEDIRDMFGRREAQMLQEIDQLSDEAALSADEDLVVSGFIERYRLSAPAVDFQDMHISEEGTKSVDVRGDVYRPLVDPNRPCLVDGQYIVVAFPFKGDGKLLVQKPVTYGFYAPKVHVTSTAIEYSFEGAPCVKQDEMKRELDSFKPLLEKALESLCTSILSFNNGLEHKAKDRFKMRRGQSESRQKALQDLGIPKRLKEAEKGTNAGKTKEVAMGNGYEFDVFISHASEDKEHVVRPLKELLEKSGCTVWLDEAVLEIGDKLRAKIDQGLQKSRFGIVILSPAFFAKDWPQYELDALLDREMSGGGKVILPVWHDVGKKDLSKYSNALAMRVGRKTADGLDKIANEVAHIIKRARSSGASVAQVFIEDEMSKAKKKILVEAAKHKNAIYTIDTDQDGLHVHIGGWSYCDSEEERKLFLAALKQLQKENLAEFVSGQLYELTYEGIQQAKKVG